MKIKIKQLVYCFVLFLLFTLPFSTSKPHIASAERQFSGGNGWPANPYLISSCDDLELMSESGVGAEYYFKLTQNIDCSATSIAEPSDPNYVDYLYNSGAGFPPIGTVDTPFYGNFNGAGFNISNLTINRPATENIGLFGYIRSDNYFSNFYNFGLIDVNITGGQNTGGVVGRIDNQISGTNLVTLQKISVSGQVTSTTVDSRSNVGGLVGKGNYVSIISSEVSATVNGEDYSGGLIGYAGPEAEFVQSNFYIYDSNFQGILNARDVVGGLVGYGKIQSVYADTTNIIAERSFSSGNISTSSGSWVGGLFGILEQEYSVGGTTIRNCYSSGDVNGAGYVGGLIGKVGADISIENVYATGLIIGQAGLSGGLIGTNTGSTITNSFYDQETTLQSDDIGNGTPKTTADMKNISTFQNASWNIALFVDRTDEVWKIDNGIDYPVLASLTTEVRDPFIIDEVDTTPPTFYNIPPYDSIINISEAQTITTNPYTIMVSPGDPSGVLKVLFYVDDALICRTTQYNIIQPDPNSGAIYYVYSCSWNTSLYHSTVKVYAYDNYNNVTEAIIRNTTVDPSLYVGVSKKPNNTSPNIAPQEETMPAEDGGIIQNQGTNNPIIEETVTNKEKNESVAQNLLNASYIALATVATASVATAGAANSFPLVPLFFNYWKYFGALLAIRKKKRWGSVFDSITQKPISGATVSLFETKYDRLVETKITDRKGRFIISAIPGEYYLIVSKEGFRFPSRYNAYGYLGRKIKIESTESMILQDIPLDPIKGEVKKKNNFMQELKTFSNILYYFILIGGTFFCLFAAFKLRNTISYLDLALYLSIWVYMISVKIFKRRAGKIYDPKRKEPVDSAIIRVFDAGTQKLVETKVTNLKGNYSLILSPGHFFVQVVSENYEPQSKEVFCIKDTYYTENFFLVRA